MKPDDARSDGTPSLLCFAVLLLPAPFLSSYCCPHFQLYPGACDGVFFDETPRVLNTLATKYRSYNTLAHSSFDTAEVSIFLYIWCFCSRQDIFWRQYTR